MRFSILAKIGILIATVLIATLATVLWNTNRIFYEDKQAFVNELSSKLSQGVSRVVIEKLSAVRSQIAVFTGNYESLTPAQKKDAQLNQFLFSQYENFYGIAAIRWKDQAYRWKVLNDSRTNTWPIGFDDQVFKNVPLVNTEDQTLRLKTIRLSDGSFAVAIVLNAKLQAPTASTGGEKDLEDVALVALVDSSLFQSVVSNYKAALNTAFLVDKEGFVFAHPDESLLGSSLVEHSVVSEIAQSNKMAGVGDSYLDLNEESIAASYEKIPGANLFAVITTPRQEAFRAANELFKSLIIIGLGVLLVGLVLSFVFTQLLTSPLKNLKRVAAEIGNGNFDIEVPIRSHDEVGDLAQSIQQMASSLIERDSALEHSKNALVQSEKMSAFGQLSAGIAHEVKNPLAGILGHAQLAKAKVKDENIKKHIEVIESETRRTKEIIENLMRFARAEKMDLIPTNLWDTVQAAVDLVDHQLSLMEVKIHRHIQRVPAVRANSNQIQQVLLNLMMNAGHAMEECEKKELHVSLSEVSESSLVRIQIRDTGHGMTEEVQKKIFEPFFTTKPAGKGTGLGLSVTIGIVKDHNAKVYVESEVNVGTSFFIDFDIAKDCELPAPTYNPKFHEEDSVQEEISSVSVPSYSAEPESVSPTETNSFAVEEEEPQEENLSDSREAFTSEDDDELEMAEEPSQIGIPNSLPGRPDLDLTPVPSAASQLEEEEEEEDFQIQDGNASSVSDSEPSRSYSAADALAGMSLEDDEDFYLEEKTVIGDIPSMPSIENKSEDDEEEDGGEESSEDTSSKKDADFKVKIRRPKIKR